MTHQHIFKIITLAVVLLNLIPVSALAEGEPRLTLAVEPLPVAAGQEVVVTVRAADVSPAVKVEAHLTFDPTTLAVVTLDHGDFLSPNPDADAFVLQKNFGNQGGTINYAVWLKPGQPAAAGNGLLATVTFQALANGPAIIEIQEGRFFSSDKVEMIAATDRVQFTIGGGAEVDHTLAGPEQPAPASPVIQEAPAPAAPPVQEQPGPDQAASTDANPVVAAVTPAVQEQSIQAVAVIDAAPETVTGPEREVEAPAPYQKPRRFKIQPPSNPGNNWLAVLLVVGLGVVVFSIGTLGFVGTVSAWFWLARSRRR